MFEHAHLNTKLEDRCARQAGNRRRKSESPLIGRPLTGCSLYIKTCFVHISAQQLEKQRF